MPDSPAGGARVDTTTRGSVSFAPREAFPPQPSAHDRPAIRVGPGWPPPAVESRSGRLGDEDGHGGGYPIDLAKVQRPALRDETLERPRLLDWLRGKINGRVVLVIADAGYGKTTLLADFSRRVRVRTLWYRLDENDRDWRSLLHHLVAAGREYDPAFAPRTSALLADVSVGGPSRDSVLDVFLEELPSIAGKGAVIVLDDYHLVDDAPDARHVARELVQRAPDRVAIVFASRRAPTVPLARLRAVGDVADLGTDDLRFDLDETEKLFTETYGRPLDPDVLADLTSRTEGWILSLQLVQAALRDRTASEIRRFVRGLSGADRDLYDYLAEEVIGELVPEMQRFLMRTSLLQVVTPPFAEAVTDLPRNEVQTLIAAAERLTLLSRVSGGPRSHQRYHPLVREFLEARFRAIDGDAAVADLHRRTAERLGPVDWRIGAHHYREAGDTAGLLEVIEKAIPTIMGNGQFALADAFIRPVPVELRQPGLDLILSRVDMQHGDYEAGISASKAVLDSADDDPVQRDHALLNLIAMYLNFGDAERAEGYSELLRDGSSDKNLVGIAEATLGLIRSAEDADINQIERRLRVLAEAQQAERPHHYGVSMYNLACCSLVQDRLESALREVGEALKTLDSTAIGVERDAAVALRVAIRARLGDFAAVDQDASEFLVQSKDRFEVETLVEAADAFASFGNVDRALALLAGITTETSMTSVARRGLALTRSTIAVRQGDLGLARRELDLIPHARPTQPGARSAEMAIRAYVASVAGDRNAADLATAAMQHAAAQNALGWRRVAELVLSMETGGPSLSEAVSVIGQHAPWHLTFVADALVRKIDQLTPGATAMVLGAARAHPERWRWAFRNWLDTAPMPEALAGARVLEEIGESQDIPRLRAIGRTHRRGASGAALGRQLIRRLADPVYVEDQGRVTVRIARRTVLGSDVRRKVLALVCFLLTRPDLSGTRDQVLDAIWPDLDPTLGQNSLNQTLYFLRRIFEEDYADDLSPGYVRHDADLIWLDPELVTSRSIQCRDLIRAMSSRPSPDEVERLVHSYQGRFALDFEYEEWAGAYRDGLHSAYLEIMERAVAEDAASGHFDRGIKVARRALEVDPSAEQIEVSLLRMYRATGAHAAAAEQYAHYAGMMRAELGIEPPPLEAV